MDGMTRPDLDALRALLSHAAGRPWTARQSDGGMRIASDLGIPVAAVRRKYRDHHWQKVAADNAALIVAAVNALPALLDYCAELERDAERLIDLLRRLRQWDMLSEGNTPRLADRDYWCEQIDAALAARQRGSGT